MRLHRFYIAGETPEKITNTELIHQWRNVFRMRAWEKVILFDKNGVEHTCSLVLLEKKSAIWEVSSSKPGSAATEPLTLAAALVKKDNFDLIIRQATEIGVTHIIPIISERSEKKDLNMERARRITIEAAEQCGRVDVPSIDEPCALENLLNSVQVPIISFDPTGPSLSRTIEKSSVILIGPEGGWTSRELSLLSAKGKLYSLPTFVLRAETASAVALGIVKNCIL